MSDQQQPEPKSTDILADSFSTEGAHQGDIRKINGHEYVFTRILGSDEFKWLCTEEAPRLSEPIIYVTEGGSNRAALVIGTDGMRVDLVYFVALPRDCGPCVMVDNRWEKAATSVQVLDADYNPQGAPGTWHRP